MEMGSFRPELHVAQQSRRDKLRVAHHLQDLEQNPDLVHVRNVNNAHNLLYDPYSSEIINFSTKSNLLSAHRDIMDAAQIVAGEDAAPFPSWSLPLSSNSNNNIIINALSKSPIEPQNYGNWVASYASGRTESNSIFGEVSNNISSAYPQSLKPGYNIGFHQDHNMRAMEAQNMRASDGGNNNNKPALLAAAYGNESSDVLCFDNAGGAWPNRAVDSCHHQWSSGDSNPQGLSLSLSSSNPALKLPGAHQFGEGSCGSEDLHSTSTTIVSKCCGKSLQDMGGISTNINTSYRNTGPLGPFTGYATILKASKFLKPAQQLLDEFCGMSDRASGEVSTSGDALNAAATETHELAAAAASSSTFFTYNEMSCDGGVGSSSSESIRPEFQQKKAKLLYMQEEVCRRYKQYHQQMQMVVSSFESVAGLSCATPYISLALKSVSRHFRCLKNAISEQLKHIGKALGEDLSSPTATTTSTSKGDANMVRLKQLDQSLQRQRYGGANVGFLDTAQQHVWRPQRGLPERSVAILRAWLFEHFLHPYPTDTDKHMLATQTGLSRNQVSNWFINARVRVWKPMVEEIHTLETKAEANKNIEGSSSSINKRVECEWNQQEKRSRMDCEMETSMDGSGSLMGFLPYQPSGAAVSLTLGLRHGAENVNVQQLQLQEDQLRQQFGGRMIRDFVG